MKQLLALVLTGLLFVGCKKDNNPDADSSGLAGKWRLFSVTDKITNITTTKPTNLSGEVEISFTFSSQTRGQMSGSTSANAVGAEYQVGRKKELSLSSLMTTYAMDTEWGYLFISTIDDSRRYSFDVEGRLYIHTSTNKELMFTKL